MLQKDIAMIQSTTIPSSQKTKETSFWVDLQQFSSARIKRLKKTILGDYYYKPKNTFKLHQKTKIFKYLQAKFMTTFTSLSEETKKKFTDFDVNYGKSSEFKSLKQMKQVILKLKTNIQAAEDGLKQSQIAAKQLKANFLNESAYEFDSQRRVSAIWGFVSASIICATIYRRGSFARKLALFLAFAHVFSQISYRWNVDKYFDTVYPIFQEDAVDFVKAEQIQYIQKQKNNSSASSNVQQ